MIRALKCIAFIPVYAFLWTITWLPPRVLYVFSDFIFLIIYYLIPYRKKLVLKNLRRSFPEKNKKEIRRISRRFYHHLCDYFIESVYGLHMSAKEINRRYRYKNPELLQSLYDRDRSVILVLGHYGNWEWTSNFPLNIPHTVMAIYKTLHNPYFDRLFVKVRSKFGLVPVPMESTLRRMIEYKQRGIKTLTIFLADQRPRWKNIQYWTTFLNQDTPVLLGPEKTAKKLDQAVVFIHVNKLKRGYYESEFILLHDDPRETGTYEITESHLRTLEKIIREEPEWWLWSHNRWKHSKDLYDKIHAR